MFIPVQCCILSRGEVNLQFKHAVAHRSKFQSTCPIRQYSIHSWFWAYIGSSGNYLRSGKAFQELISLLFIALPRHLKQPFYLLPAPTGLDFSLEPVRVAQFYEAVDYVAIEQHLREHFVVLLVEETLLSFQVLSIALTGSKCSQFLSGERRVCHGFALMLECATYTIW